MGTAVQVAVAAGLALAWIWVLGRPLLGGLRPSDTEWAGDAAGEQEGDPEFWEVEPLGRFGWHGWHQRSPAARRRQALLATMFATFGSFLLAVALRGRFVWLLGLMVFTLAVHLGIASHLGGRMLRARDEARRAGLGRHSAVGGSASSVLASAIGPDHDRVDRSYRSPISAGDHAVASFVETLIQLEWGLPADEVPTVPATPTRARVAATPAPAPAPAVPAASAPAVPAVPAEPMIEVDVLPDPPIEVDVLADLLPEAVPAAPEIEPEEPIEPAVDGVADDGEAVPPGPAGGPFIRPPGQNPPRRKARPIYIHSQLDEDGFEPPRAVNHP